MGAEDIAHMDYSTSSGGRPNNAKEATHLPRRHKAIKMSTQITTAKEKVKQVLLSSSIPIRTASRISDVHNSRIFLQFTNALIKGLREIIVTNEKILQSEPQNENLHWRIVALKWKYNVISNLLREYINLETRLNSQPTHICYPKQTVKTPQQTALLSRFSSMLSLFRSHKLPSRCNSQSHISEIGGGTKPWRANFKPPSSSTTSLNRENITPQARMHLIEQQVGNLAGAVEFSVVSVCGSSRLSTSFTKVTLNISLLPVVNNPLAQLLYTAKSCQDASLACGLDSSPDNDRTIGACYPLQHTSATIYNSSEWCLECRLITSKSRSSLHPIQDLDSNFDLDMKYEWEFSNKQHIFSLEPFSYLMVNAVRDSSSKPVQKQCLELHTLFGTDLENVTVNITCLSSPYVDIAVRWHPLTNLDYAELKKTQLPITFTTEPFWINPSLTSKYPQFFDRHHHTSHESQGSRHSLMSIQDPNTQTVSSDSFISSMEPFGVQEDHLSNSRSIIETHSIRSKQSSEFIDSKHDELKSDLLGVKLEEVRTDVEILTRRPSRFSKVLLNLSAVIDCLLDQLLKSSENQNLASKVPRNTVSTTETEAVFLIDSVLSLNSLRCRKTHSPTLMGGINLDNDEATSSTKLSESKETSETFLNDTYIPLGRFDLTSGWSELDEAIEWHLDNLSLMLKAIAASDRISDSDSRYGGSIDNLYKAVDNSLTVNEDIIALAIESQSEILSDLTGLALEYSENQDTAVIVSKAHCLAFGGTKRKNNLLPTSFWNLVWTSTSENVDAEDSEIVNNQLVRITSTTPHLIIKCQQLQDFILHEFGNKMTDDADCYSSSSVTDALMEQLLDTEITDKNWDWIPLTQLCYRLKVHEFADPTSFAVNGRNSSCSKTNSFISNRSSSSMLRKYPPIVNETTSLSAAFHYLLTQWKLQQNLREPDEEILFSFMKDFHNKLKKTPTECVDVSIHTMICVALILQSEEAMVCKCASDLLEEMNKITMPTYEFARQHLNLPFLRSSGPCFNYLKALEQFSGRLSLNLSIRWVFKTPPFTTGYHRLTPTGIAMLWGMQSVEIEEYRSAGLAASEFLLMNDHPDSNDSIYSASSSSSVLVRNRRRDRRLINTDDNVVVARDNAGLAAEVKRMNLGDSSAQVRNLALKIIMARKARVRVINQQKIYNSSNCLLKS